MSATATTTYRLTINDRREPRLSNGLTLCAEYDFASLDSAEMLGQLLLQQTIQAPGQWQVAIAGGTREVTIDEILEADAPDVDPSAGVDGWPRPGQLPADRIWTT
jgi:hypothetical protein